MNDKEHSISRLRSLSSRLKHQADLIRNGEGNPQAEKQAGSLLDDAHAIDWALREIDPVFETHRQFFEELKAS